ncbi:MAG TPA: DUF1653 domain-containing protein, partial [Solirubrobacteraceae bacterium]
MSTLRAPLVPYVGGTYRHYKGDLYKVVRLGRLSEQRDVECVVYQSLERGHTWIRPLAMWCETVQWPDGCYRARFILQATEPLSEAECSARHLHFFDGATLDNNQAAGEPTRGTFGGMLEEMRGEFARLRPIIEGRQS